MSGPKRPTRWRSRFVPGGLPALQWPLQRHVDGLRGRLQHAWTGWTSRAGAKTSTRDCWGQYCYVRNLDDGRVWSAGRQPIGRNADEYEADLRSDRAIIRRRDSDMETCYEIAVVPDADAEVRRVTLTNRGDRPRTLEVTSYAEVALNPRRADQAHPAFAKLFLETEYHASSPALLCRRRPRAPDQQPVWALQVLASEVPGEVEYETDRARFLGRGRSTRNPAAMDGGVGTFGDRGSGAGPGVQPAPADPGGAGSVHRPGVHHRRAERPGSGSGAGRPVRQPGDRGPRLQGDHRERRGAAGGAGPDAG